VLAGAVFGLKEKRMNKAKLSLRKRCPECGEEFGYDSIYEPATCGKFDCVWKHLHPEVVEAKQKRLRR